MHNNYSKHSFETKTSSKHILKRFTIWKMLILAKAYPLSFMINERRYGTILRKPFSEDCITQPLYLCNIILSLLLCWILWNDRNLPNFKQRNCIRSNNQVYIEIYLHGLVLYVSVVSVYVLFLKSVTDEQCFIKLCKCPACMHAHSLFSTTSFYIIVQRIKNLVLL